VEEVIQLVMVVVAVQVVIEQLHVFQCLLHL